MCFPEVESRTQGSRPRPRTQKKSEAKAKDSLSEDRHSRGQGQTLSRPRTGMLEANAKDQGHKAQVLSKRRKVFTKIFQAISKKKKKKVFSKIFQAISIKKRVPKNFSNAPQNFSIPKNSAVRPIFEDSRPRGQGLQNLSSRPRTSSRTPPLVFS